MDSIANSYIGAKKVVTGQVLKPNARYFVPFECDNFSLPSREILKEGDTFELMRTLEPKQITMNIPNGLFFDKTSVFENSFSWEAADSNGARQVLTIIYNGLDFQHKEYTTQASIKSVRSGTSQFTSSSSFTVPIGVSKIKVTAAGGGGGGGGGACAHVDPGSNMYGQSGSGAGAGAVIKDAIINVVSGQVIPIIVGAGGSGGRGGYTGYANAGAQGTDGGQTKVGSFLVVNGGKKGLGGDYGDGSYSKESPSKAGGLGGQAVTGESLGTYFEGGYGGYSGKGTTVTGSSTKGGDGQSVNGFLGGQASPLQLSDRNGTAGGGGSSALASGGNGGNSVSNTNAQGYGAGGAGGQGVAYNGGSADGGKGGNGGSGFVLIEWSRE